MIEQDDGGRVQGGKSGGDFRGERRCRFDLVPGASAPPELEMLKSAFDFASNSRAGQDEPALQFGIFNDRGELALLCVLRGFLQASEFSSLIARAGYTRRSKSVPGCDFIYFPGAGLEAPTTTRSTLS